MLGKITDYLSAHRKELFFIFLIFLLAFGIRGHQFVYELFFEFDGYYHARMTEYTLIHNAIPATDPLAYYQLPGGAPNPQFQDGPFWWMFTGTLFRILTLGAPYSREAFFFAIKLFPALFGSLICVAMYFLGKEMYNRRAGALMAFFAAVIPAFVYRTMAGWFEGQSLGFLWLVIGLVFLVRAIKPGKLDKTAAINAIVAGFFFAVMSWNWQAYLMAPYILIGFAGLTAFAALLRIVFFEEKLQAQISPVAVTMIAFAAFMILSSAVIGEHFTQSAVGNVSALFGGAGGSLDLGGAGQTQGSVFSSSVGEESKGLGWWGNKYNAMWIFIGWPFQGFPYYIPGLVFIFLLYRMLKNRGDRVSLLAFTWIAFAIFLAYIKLKFTFYLGIPLALAGGITINELLSFVGERPGFEKKIIALASGFILLVGVAAGSYFISQNTPNIEYDTGWKESLKWMAAELPPEAKMFNWWDEGHWVTFIGQKKVITDNRNMDLPTNSDYAKLVLAKSEDEAIGIIKSRYNSDYLLISDDLIEKMGSLGVYAYQTTDTSDPRIARYMAARLLCSRETDALSKQVTVNCGGNSFSEAQFNSFPTTRVEQPNILIGGKTRAYVYRNEDGSKVFLMNQASNDTFIVKLFFEQASIKHFQQVYANKDVRIFKIV
ncbi:Oligosaccharyl transferase STT3 subunit [uncultured archaeon]|nr:Oligosaccharyl transferase STT3 subunit [uncultured archaeon]